MRKNKFFQDNISKTLFYGLIFNLIFLLSCNKIETNETLSKKDIELIQKLNLLDKDEKIIKFYSEAKRSVAGNFYTNKRLAKYWLDERDEKKNEVEFAYYKDIIKIEPKYSAGATYCPFLLVTRKDNTSFKVCADGEESEIKAFFNDAISKWTQNKN